MAVLSPAFPETQRLAEPVALFRQPPVEVGRTALVATLQCKAALAALPALQAKQFYAAALAEALPATAAP
jgi:hypothetical protein